MEEKIEREREREGEEGDRQPVGKNDAEFTMR